ncbi:MAG: hypothetical protein KDD51_11580, partial [Bdellovibrionales bacterium]|nr:hypothetical protein [Bdellovibrionales bacterium]
LAEGLGMGAMGMNAAQHLSYELQRYYLREVPSPELQTPFWRLLVRFYRQYDIAYFVHDWESLSTFFQRYPE